RSGQEDRRSRERFPRLEKDLHSSENRRNQELLRRDEAGADEGERTLSSQPDFVMEFSGQQTSCLVAFIRYTLWAPNYSLASAERSSASNAHPEVAAWPDLQLQPVPKSIQLHAHLSA